MRTKSWLVIASVAGVLGCGAAQPASSQATRTTNSAALVTSNGISENGERENGERENGERENGERENGIKENGSDDGTVVSVELSPVVLTGSRVGVVLDASLHGSTLTGHVGHTTVSGADFVGAYFVANVHGGLPTTVRVTDHKFDAATNSDLDLYAVQQLVIDLHGLHWVSLCADEQGNPAYASAVSGYWDYSKGTATGGDKIESSHRFTFTCPTGAIYKCVEWGYRPWSSVNGVSLSPYHQACTRMTRADYCGDGTPHTTDGSVIDLYDNLGIQTDTASWVFEAQWNADGATCIAPGGVANNGAGISCYSHLARSNCTANSPSAMLSTETPHGIRQP